MEYVHRGIDGLDISYPVHIAEEHLPTLLEAQKTAASMGKNQTKRIDINGQALWVRPRGHAGGYSFSCTTGHMGENLFLKKPESGNEYGLRVSVNALPLAIYGLHKVRSDLEAKLLKLGMIVRPGDERIARLDVAIDLLVSGLSIKRENIVVPSRVDVACYSDEVEMHGSPTQITSVRMGKNPNRQVVIYDKVKEITEQAKPYWWLIWDKRREAVGLPPLNRENLAGSKIWRTEIRFYKKYLKERMEIKTFNELIDKLPHLTETITRDFRLVIPSADQNRNRWKTHPFWSRASAELLEEVLQIEPFELTEKIRTMSLGERFASGSKQVMGMFYYLAAIRGVGAESFENFVVSHLRQCVANAQAEDGLIATRIDRATDRLMDFAPSFSTSKEGAQNV